MQDITHEVELSLNNEISDKTILWDEDSLIVSVLDNESQECLVSDCSETGKGRVGAIVLAIELISSL